VVNVIASTALANFRDDEIDVAIPDSAADPGRRTYARIIEEEYFRWRKPEANAESFRRRRATWSRCDSSARTAILEGLVPSVGVRSRGKAKAARPLIQDSTYALQAPRAAEGIALARRSIVARNLEPRGREAHIRTSPFHSRERYWS